MAVQDDRRENELRQLFQLREPAKKSRTGVDAVLHLDGAEVPFELKSSTGSTVSTARDVGADHIVKWRQRHWLFGFYYVNQRLLYCLYGSPARMKPWIDKVEEYIRPDVVLAQRAAAHLNTADLYAVFGRKGVYTLDDARKVHKKQYSNADYLKAMDLERGYSPKRMLDILRERAQYIASRGATLNNPHIPASYFDAWPRITVDHATELRRLVRDALAGREGIALAQVGEDVL